MALFLPVRVRSDIQKGINYRDCKLDCVSAYH